MRGAFTAFALIGALVLAGCGGASGDTGGSPTPSPGQAAEPTLTLESPTPSDPPTGPAAESAVPTTSVTPEPRGTEVPSDVPTIGPNMKVGERPPVMPAVALEHTTAGAVAFAKFFELTIDWAYATTSTAYMKHYFEPSCVTCRSIRDGIDNAAAKRRHFLGDRFSIKNVGKATASQRYSSELTVDVSYVVSAAEVLDSRGRFVDGEKELRLEDRIWLAWKDLHWTVAAMGPPA